MTFTTALILIMAYHVFCTVSWRIERTELINKLMSRNFHEYQFAKAAAQQPDIAQAVKREDSLAEDLAPIHGFGMN